MNRNRIPAVEKLIGMTAIFSVVVGFVALLVALASFLSSDYSAAGLSLIAAALGFGLFSHAALNS